MTDMERVGDWTAGIETNGHAKTRRAKAKPLSRDTLQVCAELLAQPVRLEGTPEQIADKAARLVAAQREIAGLLDDG